MQEILFIMMEGIFLIFVTGSGLSYDDDDDDDDGDDDVKLRKSNMKLLTASWKRM
jgi:hypothetical protein